ncbi:Vta1 like-domain-containing protein [Powellomyces hirtus]|nr:Vta1 like-domain-containing protein [Powellomyces hirtus]
MPGGAPPDELKFVTPYLQRSQELQGKEPIVAYYCKYYAVKLAVEKGMQSKEGKAYLFSIMDEIELDKKNLAGNEVISNDVVGYAHIENFALRIFHNADSEDRQGRASKKTAKTFLAASMFLELLKVFGEIDTEVKDKVRYSKFKAADIIKAIREGRTPTPGIPGEERDDAVDGGQPTAADEPHPDFGSPYDPSFDPAAIPPRTPTNFEPNSYPPPGGTPYSATPPSTHSYPTSAPKPVAASSRTSAPDAAPPISPTAANKFGAAYDSSFKAIQAAQKHSRFAISALQYDDVKTAIENLEQALAILRPISK